MKPFCLRPLGIQEDQATWYKISDVYVGVTKIAELRSENVFYPPGAKTGYRGIETPSFHYPTDFLQE